MRASVNTPTARSISVIVLGVLLILMMTGCGTIATSSTPIQLGGGDVAPDWQLLWLPPVNGISQHIPVQAAFAAGAKVEFRSDGVYHPPARIQWLVTSTNFDLALVQLDDAGRYKMIVHMEVSSTHTWNEDQTSLPDPVRCDDPGPLPGAKAILGDLCSFGYLHTPTYDESIWSAPTGALYFADRIGGDIQRPLSSTTSITVDGAQGWMQNLEDVTTLVLPVLHGGTCVFTGIDDPSSVQELAQRYYPHLNALFSA